MKKIAAELTHADPQRRTLGHFLPFSDHTI
jgi:hypothetical protein